jgi:hypothetical protein
VLRENALHIEDAQSGDVSTGYPEEVPDKILRSVQMPRLPAFDLSTKINHSPHVVILGAGATRAAFPDGDANRKRLPLLADLPDCLGLRTAISSAGFSAEADFESIYDELATSGRCLSLKAEIESQVRSYFELLVLPEAPTIYDYLLLSLRKNDLIATFNWDPFLAQAFRRNRQVSNLPQIAFLHGNVEIGVCIKDGVKGFRGDACQKCGESLQTTTLLYPVRNKNYQSDPFIANEWQVLSKFLEEAYMVTIFGYSAPATDAAAVDLMSKTWGDNPTFELGQVSIVDVKPEAELENTWKPFFCRSHYGIHEKLCTTWVLRHPRRSCEALAMATLQNAPWQNNPFPQFQLLPELQDWIAPLVAEENEGYFSGMPCPQLSNPSQSSPQRSVHMGIDWVLGWLKAMCKGKPIPPLCVELFLKDGTQHYLHSILAFEDETRTLCARIWDLRAFGPKEIDELKQRLNQSHMPSGAEQADPVHPKLDWANIRLHYDDIAYHIEWHDRIWPDDERPKIGFVDTKND